MFFLPFIQYQHIDSIRPQLTYYYTRTAKPKNLRDLGATTYTYIGITRADALDVTITIDISISLTAAFNGTTPLSNVELQNQGLEREIKAHEEPHTEQIVEAACKPIALVFKVDGKRHRYIGRADKVILGASWLFSQSSKAAVLDSEQKQRYIQDRIVLPALKRVGRNIDCLLQPSLKTEADANSRAIAVLGAQSIKYINGNTSVIFNELILR